MKILRTATAGTLESNDVMVYVSPGEAGGVVVEVNSIVEKLYGEHIAGMVEKLVAALGVENAKVVLQDRGALDFAIKARVETAVLRAAREDA